MKKIKNILILAGGDSSRFWPLEHKNLFTFSGKPLIQQIVDSVSPYGEHIYITTNSENNNSIAKIFGDKVGLILQNNHDRGMGGAVLSAKSSLAGETVVLNANDIIDFAVLPGLKEKAEDSKFRFVFLAKKMDVYFPGGYLQLNGDKLVGIIEKPNPKELPSNLVNLVVDYFTDITDFMTLLESMRVDGDDWYEQALTAYIHKTNCGFIVYDKEWETIKYPWQVLPMMTFFLQKKIKPYTGDNVSIAKSAVLSGTVHLGNNVKVGDHAKIVGPCFIDDNTFIGDNALVCQSQIGKNCVIGGYSEVTRSYLGDRVSLHRNYVGDSVLFDEVHFGAGAITANYRFDAKPVLSVIGGQKFNTNLLKLGSLIGRKTQIGVQSSLLPGVKIGRNTLVGPNSLVAEDIEDNQFLFKGVKKPNQNQP